MSTENANVSYSVPHLKRGIFAGLVAVLSFGALPPSLNAQIVAVTARYGWAPTERFDDAFGIGLELEVMPNATIVAGGRLEAWGFGVGCVGLDPCPNGVMIAAAAARYRIPTEGTVDPYVGGDAGYMRWTSGASGISMRARGGVDIQLIRHIDLNIDGGYTRLVELWNTDRRTLQDSLVGFSAGLRLWF